MAGSIGILILLLAAPATGSARFPWATGPFCEGQTVAPFLRQMERLPPLREPPTLDRIGAWAPATVHLSSTATIQTPPASVGWLLDYGALPRRLDWSVTTRLTEVTRAGVPFGPKRVKQFEVGRPGRDAFSDISFPVPAEPAIFRVEIAFRNAGGRLLGRFGRHFRVLRPRSQVRLGLDHTLRRPGERVRARVENLGTSRVSYGVPYRIEQFDGEAWTRAPQSPTGPWIRPLWLSGAGRSGNCNSFWVPPGMPPGTYRFVKPLHQPRRTIHASFEVLPPGELVPAA